MGDQIEGGEWTVFHLVHCIKAETPPLFPREATYLEVKSF